MTPHDVILGNWLTRALNRVEEAQSNAAIKKLKLQGGPAFPSDCTSWSPPDVVLPYAKILRQQVSLRERVSAEDQT